MLMLSQMSNSIYYILNFVLLVFSVFIFIFRSALHRKHQRRISTSIPQIIDLVLLRQPHSRPFTRLLMNRTQIITHVGRNQIGDRAFQAAAPALWNCLPRNIREACSITSFKKLLKTHYYAT